MVLANQKVEGDDYFEVFLFLLQDQAWFIDLTLVKSGVKQGFNVFLRRNREEEKLFVRKPHT